MLSRRAGKGFAPLGLASLPARGGVASASPRSRGARRRRAPAGAARRFHACRRLNPRGGGRGALCPGLPRPAQLPHGRGAFPHAPAPAAGQGEPARPLRPAVGAITTRSCFAGLFILPNAAPQAGTEAAQLRPCGAAPRKGEQRTRGLSGGRPGSRGAGPLLGTVTFTVEDLDAKLWVRTTAHLSPYKVVPQVQRQR